MPSSKIALNQQRHQAIIAISIKIGQRPPPDPRPTFTFRLNTFLVGISSVVRWGRVSTQHVEEPLPNAAVYAFDA
jgi:hypothetical protein